MKKIIKGKRYDTDTATLIASYNNGLSCGDFRHIYEDLYITQKGQWLMEYEGGPKTKYAITCGNRIDGDSDLILLSENEAYDWIEKHQHLCDFEDVIEKYFKDHIIEEG
jgi:hypothetical protein